MFVSAEQTTKILLILATSVSSLCFITSIGTVPCRIVYLLFNIAIMRSTCTLTFDSSFEHSTSCCESCVFPLVKAGIISVPPLMLISS